MSDSNLILWTMHGWKEDSKQLHILQTSFIAHLQCQYAMWSDILFLQQNCWHFKIIQFFLLMIWGPNLKVKFCVQPVKDVMCSLFSQSYDSWPFMFWSFHLYPLSPRVQDSAKVQMDSLNKKKEDKFQIENLMSMLRKCFITFKKTVEVSVGVHMIPVSFLCHSLSFFSSFHK